MTVINAAGFARDAGERAVKTLIQTGAAFGIAELANLDEAITSGADGLTGQWAIFVPIIITAISVATSFLSKFRGDPNSASGSKV